MFIIIEPWESSELGFYSVALKKKMAENSECFAMTAREMQETKPFNVDSEEKLGRVETMWDLVYWPNERIAGMWRDQRNEQGLFEHDYDNNDLPALWFENISWERAVGIWMSVISSPIKKLDMAIG